MRTSDLGGEEHAVVACHGGRELAQEVLVYASDDVVALFVECRVVENADNACQKLVAKLGISIRQNARQAGVEAGNGIHSRVHGTADVCLRRKVQQVVVASLFWNEHGSLSRVVLWFLRRLATFDERTFGIYLRIGALEAAPGVAQENKSQHRHAILLAGEL